MIATRGGKRAYDAGPFARPALTQVVGTVLGMVLLHLLSAGPALYLMTKGVLSHRHSEDAVNAWWIGR